MTLIATHDSATGEASGSFLSYLVLPFARTQSKTIRQQLEEGCTMFDMRVRLVGDTFYCAHGLWRSERSAESIIADIDEYALQADGDGGWFVCLTYEGGYEYNDAFLAFAHQLKALYVNIRWLAVSVKYGKEAKGICVKYDQLIPADESTKGIRTEQAFLPLDGHSWHTYLPIPWLWDRLYKRPHSFNTDIYRWVDFL